LKKGKKMLDLVELRFAVDDIEPGVGFDFLNNDKVFQYLISRDYILSLEDRRKIVKAVLEAINRSDVYEVRKVMK
jgi:hypothetical protein